LERLGDGIGASGRWAGNIIDPQHPLPHNPLLLPLPLPRTSHPIILLLRTLQRHPLPLLLLRHLLRLLLPPKDPLPGQGHTNPATFLDLGCFLQRLGVELLVWHPIPLISQVIKMVSLHPKIGRIKMRRHLLAHLRHRITHRLLLLRLIILFVY
jgi:hypothetical protein